MFKTNVGEKLETHILCSITFCGNLGVYELIWQNVVERGRPRMVMWRMRIACWMSKATNAYTGCVILIDFPLQQ